MNLPNYRYLKLSIKIVAIIIFILLNLLIYRYIILDSCFNPNIGISKSKKAVNATSIWLSLTTFNSYCYHLLIPKDQVIKWLQVCTIFHQLYWLHLPLVL